MMNTTKLITVLQREQVRCLSGVRKTLGILGRLAPDSPTTITWNVTDDKGPCTNTILYQCNPWIVNVHPALSVKDIKWAMPRWLTQLSVIGVDPDPDLGWIPMRMGFDTDPETMAKERKWRELIAPSQALYHWVARQVQPRIENNSLVRAISPTETARVSYLKGSLKRQCWQLTSPVFLDKSPRTAIYTASLRALAVSKFPGGWVYHQNAAWMQSSGNLIMAPAAGYSWDAIFDFARRMRVAARPFPDRSTD